MKKKKMNAINLETFVFEYWKQVLLYYILDYDIMIKVDILLEAFILAFFFIL